MGVLRHRRNCYGGKDGRNQASRGAADGAHHRFRLRFVEHSHKGTGRIFAANEHPSGSTNVKSRKVSPAHCEPPRSTSARARASTLPSNRPRINPLQAHHVALDPSRKASVPPSRHVAQARPWRVLARPSAKADRARGILFASSGTELDQSMQTGTEWAGRPASSKPPVRLTTGTTGAVRNPGMSVPGSRDRRPGWRWRSLGA